MSERDAGDVVQDFHRLYYNQASRTWANTFWLGTTVYKTPLDLWIYQELIHELKPDLIVECGTASGGSALFLASICDLVGCGRVITIDIATHAPGHADAPRPKHPRISYVLGSSTETSTVDLVRAAARGANRVMVILDSDHSCGHVLNELRIYADVVTRGSYLIVEDSNINGHPVLPGFGAGPMEAITQFLVERHDFDVDASREKFYLTFNPRGYLKKF